MAGIKITSIFLFTAFIAAGIGVAPLNAAYENVPEPKTYLNTGPVQQANPVVSYANVPQPKTYLPASASNQAGASGYSNLPQPKMLDYNSVPDANPAKKTSQTIAVETDGNAQESVSVVSPSGNSFAGAAAEQRSNVPGVGSIFINAEVTEN